MTRQTLLALLPALAACAAHAQVQLPYDRTIDAVYYTDPAGTDFHMDVFVPNGKATNAAWQPSEIGKGRAIVDVASGAWSGDRGKIEDHETAQVYNIFCAKSFTVFAIRPGSRPKYTALEMAEHVRQGIRFVKANAAKYGIDPDRIGLTGASAGGHLALLASLTPAPAETNAADATRRVDSSVKAVGVFFPPTDFLNWGGRSGPDIDRLLNEILFKNGAAGESEETVQAAAREASPVHKVHPGAPPMIIYHGDADPAVPLQQSEVFVEAMKKAGNDIELVVKPGGGHPWLDIPLDVLKLANWFGERLK